MVRISGGGASHQAPGLTAALTAADLSRPQAGRQFLPAAAAALYNPH